MSMLGKWWGCYQIIMDIYCLQLSVAHPLEVLQFSKKCERPSISAPFLRITKHFGSLKMVFDVALKFWMPNHILFENEFLCFDSFLCITYGFLSNVFIRLDGYPLVTTTVSASNFQKSNYTVNSRLRSLGATRTGSWEALGATRAGSWEALGATRTCSQTSPKCHPPHGEMIC